jgi:o-succinylbenzoate synthase
MKIKAIKPYVISIPLSTPFKIATGVTEVHEAVLIKFETDDDEIYGWGESAPSENLTGETVNSVMAVLRDHFSNILIGRDPCEIEALMAELDATVPGNTSAKAGIDIALHDIMGKCANLPIRTLIGGYRKILDTSITIGIEDLNQTVGEAKRLADAGAKVLKLKIGLEPELDIARIKAVRDAVGYEVNLRVDANQGYTVATAIKTLQALEKYELEFVEQPVDRYDLDGMREVRKNVGIPIMADESVHTPSDAIKLIESKSADLINIKLMKAGGLRSSMKIATIAEAAGVGCMCGCMIETRVGITAATHLALGMKNIQYADLDGHLFLTSDITSDSKSGAILDAGTIRIDRYQPGLGVDVRTSLLSSLLNI